MNSSSTRRGNTPEKGNELLSNAQLIDFSILRRTSQELRLGLSEEALIAIVRSGEGDAIQSRDPSKLAFYRFMGGMGFSDPAISRFLYRKYDPDTEALLEWPNSQMAKELRLEYRFYGAKSLRDIRSMLVESDITQVVSLTRRNGTEDRTIDKASLIRQVEQFFEPFQLAESAFSDISRIRDNTGNALSDILRGMLKTQSDTSKKRILKDDLNYELDKVFHGNATYALTRKIGLRWHVQRMFLPFVRKRHQAQAQKCREELGGF